MLKSVVRAGALVVGVLGAMAVTAGSAQAEVGQEDGNLVARATTVRVTSTPGSPIASGTYTIPVPPKCWWESIPLDFDLSGDFDADDPVAFQEWYDKTVIQMRGHAAAGYFALPSREEVQRIVKLEKSGVDYTWYQLGHQEGVNCADEGFTETRGTVGDAYGALGAGDYVNVNIEVGYAAFPAAVRPPAPLVDVEDLSEILWDEVAQQVEEPVMERNPTITAMGGATLVNLPTWFWLTNVQGALAQDGTIGLRAEIPGSPVYTEIDVETTGVDVASPRGANTCSVEAAKTSYSDGASEDSACTVTFSQANRGGWPVTSTIQWTGGWEGRQGNGEMVGGDLALTRSGTVDVPVGESQALVRTVR